MKAIIILGISFYQLIISPILKQLIGTSAVCRFKPTCSDYAKDTIMKNGIIKGTEMSCLRLVKCQPFFKI